MSTRIRHIGPALPLTIAGYATVLLVWYVTARSTSAHPLYANLGCAAFLLAFFLLDRCDAPRLRAPLLLVEAVGAAVVLIATPGSVAPILYIVFIASLTFLVSTRITVAAALAAGSLHFLVLWGIWDVSAENAVLSVLLYGSFQAFAILIARNAREAEEARQHLAEVNAELMATRSLLEESARDRERLRVSRELHDVAGHTLTALKLNLRGLVHTKDPAVRETATQCLELSQRLLTDVRAMVSNLRRFDGLDLRAALEQLAAPFPKPRFEFEFADGVAAPDLESARLILAIAREAITNVVRHAEATTCVIRLRDGEHGLELTVEDDGRGSLNHDSRGGLGLHGMRERLGVVGGSLSLNGREGGGSRLIARLGSPA